jgi:hypothetical protein
MHQLSSGASHQDARAGELDKPLPWLIGKDDKNSIFQARRRPDSLVFVRFSALKP